MRARVCARSNVGFHGMLRSQKRRAAALDGPCIDAAQLQATINGLVPQRKVTRVNTQTEMHIFALAALAARSAPSINVPVQVFPPLCVKVDNGLSRSLFGRQKEKCIYLCQKWKPTGKWVKCTKAGIGGLSI